MKAEQAAQVDAERQARAEASARLTPVTDAEIARYGASAEPEAEAGARGGPRPSGQDRAAALEEIRAEVGALGAKVDQLARPGPPSGALRWLRRASTSLRARAPG